MRVPVLTWSGWYDNFTGEQLADLQLILATHPAPETVHLMVGPWDHEGSGEHTDHAVCVPVPPTAAHRWDAYQAFFDRYVMQAADAAPVPAVEVFTLNDGWQRPDAWPPSGATPTAYHLRAGGVLSTEPPAADEEPDSLRLRPGEPGHGDRWAATAGCCARHSATGVRSSSGRTSCRTPLPRSPPTSS